MPSRDDGAPPPGHIASRRPTLDKIKAYLVEKIRLQPNIVSLDEITAYVLSHEADDVAKKSTLSQANRVNKIEEKDKDPAKKKYKCRI